MIPWFVVHLVGFVARLCGYDTCVRAWSGRRFVERIYFTKRLPGVRYKALKPAGPTYSLYSRRLSH